MSVVGRHSGATVVALFFGDEPGEVGVYADEVFFGFGGVAEFRCFPGDAEGFFEVEEAFWCQFSVGISFAYFWGFPYE